MRFRKARNRSRKGVATMLGAVLAIALLVTVIATFFITNQSFANDYQTTVSELAELNRQTAAEEMRVFADNDTGKLRVSVENIGGIPFTVIALFISDDSTGNLTVYTEGSPPPPAGCFDPCIPRTINPGNRKGVVPAITDYLTDVTPIPGNNYTMKVLTERGTVGVGVFPPSWYVPNPGGGTGGSVPSEAELSVGYGQIRLNFESFRFINTQAGTSPDGVDQTGGKVKLIKNGLTIPGYPAFALPQGERILFAGNFTNRDWDERSIRLNAFSIATSGAAPASSPWYIVEDYDVDTGVLTPLALNETILMAWEVPTLVYFGVTNPGGSTIQSVPSSTSSTFFPGIFITMSGKLEDKNTYGQTLPFIATTIVNYDLYLDRYNVTSGTDFTILESSPTRSKFSSNMFETNIKAGLIFTDGTTIPMSCVGGAGACYEEAGGYLHGSFTIPSGLNPGYYGVYITDGLINTVWATIQVTG